MLWFLAKRNHLQMEGKTPSKANIICKAAIEAWKLAEEISEMGAEQIGDGWADFENASRIKDKKAASEMRDMGAKYGGMGLDFTKHVSLLKDEIQIIATAHGCRLAPR